MHINYIQKYVSTTGVTNRSLGGPLEKSLQNAVKTVCTIANNKNYEMGLVISPGYLSTQQNTADDLVNEITKGLIKGEKISNCWILGTMNGDNKPTKQSKYSKILNFTVSAFRKVSTVTIQPNLIKSPAPFAKDHRKMFFILLWKNKSLKPVLRGKGDISTFIKNVVVPVATIGSSNFSRSTYFLGNDHNESDILWIDDDVLNKINNTNNQIYNDEILPNNYLSPSNNGVPIIVSATVNSLKKNNISNYLRLILEQTLKTVLS